MKKLTGWILPIAALVICIISISGCNAIKRLDALSIQQPTEFLRLSNLINPCFNGNAKSDTVFQAGKPDTVYQKGDTVITHKHDTTYITVHDTKYINKTNTVTVRDTVPDNRAIAALNAQLHDCQTNELTASTKLDDAEATSKTRLWWIIGLASVIGIYIVVKVYSFFSGGAVVDVVKKVV